MRRFNDEEIREIIHSAQVFAPGFGKEHYGKLTEMQQELAESGFIDTAWGMRRLEREHGVPCSQALDGYLQLLRDQEALGSEVARLQKRRRLEKKRLAETKEACQKAEAERRREEKELISLKQEAEKEKRHVKQELERAMKDAEVEHSDITPAGRLKAEIKCYGLTLELASKLLSEFAGDKDALKHLAQAAAEHESQLEARVNLREENEAAKLETEQMREELARLTADCQQHRDAHNRLTSDLKEQETLRRFRGRYQN